MVWAVCLSVCHNFSCHTRFGPGEGVVVHGHVKREESFDVMSDLM